jgi:glycosyltransferase involved in cell wall biosynthesis
VKNSLTNSTDRIAAVSSTVILIPAFNEEDRIGTVIAGIKKNVSSAEIVVVDDGSGDETADISRQAGATVIRHPFNLGVGSALQTGYKYAAEQGFSRLIQLDADGQHDPAQIQLLLTTLDSTHADLVIGSRFLTDNWRTMSVPRRIGVRLFAWLLSMLIRERITDPTSGFRAMTKRVLGFCTKDIYGFDYPDADFLLTLHRYGFKLLEVPIEVQPRTGGVSQHRGLKPVYYFMKMFLSIFVILLREKSVKM